MPHLRIASISRRWLRPPPPAAQALLGSAYLRHAVARHWCGSLLARAPRTRFLLKLSCPPLSIAQSGYSPSPSVQSLTVLGLRALRRKLRDCQLDRHTRAGAGEPSRQAPSRVSFRHRSCHLLLI